MLSFLGALPVIGNIVTAIVTALFDAKVAITRARIGGDRDVAVSIVKAASVEQHERTASLAVIAGSWLLTLLVVAFATPLAIFEWKVVVYDIVVGLGSTDPIKGQVADWATTIIAFIFGAPTALTLGRMWFGRSKS